MFGHTYEKLPQFPYSMNYQIDPKGIRWKEKSKENTTEKMIDMPEIQIEQCLVIPNKIGIQRFDNWFWQP